MAKATEKSTCTLTTHHSVQGSFSDVSTLISVICASKYSVYSILAITWVNFPEANKYCSMISIIFNKRTRIIKLEKNMFYCTTCGAIGHSAANIESKPCMPELRERLSGRGNMQHVLNCRASERLESNGCWKNKHRATWDGLQAVEELTDILKSFHEIDYGSTGDQGQEAGSSEDGSTKQRKGTLSLNVSKWRLSLG